MIPLDPEVVHRLGWALVHFVWQGAALAAVAAVTLRGLRRRAAAVRYLAACAALAAMVAAPVATLSLVPPAPTVTHRDTGEEISGSETVVLALPPAGAPAAPASLRNASWAARIAPAIESALPQMVLAWLIGALGVSVWYAGGWVWVRRLIWKRAQPAAERWRQVAADLARRMRVSRPVRLLESAAVRVPTLVGCLRPVILLPASVLTGLAPEQIEALLAHELAHVRRWDYLVNLGQTLAEALFFYHPAVWWLSRRIRVEREQCCDDAVVATCGDRVAYARALATLGESSAGPAAALAAGGGRLLARIRRILTMQPDTRNERGWGAVALVGIAAALMAALAMTLCGGSVPAALALAEDRPAAATLPVAGGLSVPTPSGAGALDQVPGDGVLLDTWIMSLAPDAGPPLTIPLEGGAGPAEAAAGAPRPPRLLVIPGTRLPVVLTASDAERVIVTLKACPRVTMLSSPRVISADNHEARVFVGSQDPVREGVDLTMTPHVDRERRQVALDWRFVLWQRDPPNNRNEVSARVTLPDGGAVMLSGGTIPHPPKGNHRVYVLIRATTVKPKKSPAEMSNEGLQALRDREAAQKLAPHGQDAAAYREALARQPDGPMVTQILALRYRDAADLADVLSAFFQGEPGAKEKPNVIADARQNAIIVRADPATIARIADLIQRIDRPPATASTRMPTVSAAEVGKMVDPLLQAEAAVAGARANAEAAKATAAAAEADAVGPANDLKRCQELFAAKLISQQQLDAATTAARAAAAKHEAALKQADAAKAAIGQAEAALHDANAVKAMRAEPATASTSPPDPSLYGYHGIASPSIMATSSSRRSSTPRGSYHGIASPSIMATLLPAADKGYAPMSEEDKKRLEETNRLLDNDLDVSFSEMSLADVLQYLREVCSLNIIVSPDLPKVVLTRPLVNMNVKQVATKHILRIALVGSGLDYEVGPGYVLILARRTPEQADLFRKGYTSTSIPQRLGVGGGKVEHFGFRKGDALLVPIAHPPGEKAGETTEVRIYRLKHAESDAVARLLAQTCPDDSAKVVSDARANCLRVVASPERHAQIEELIKQFDQPANETPKQGQGVAPPPKPAARGAPAADAARAEEAKARNAAQTVQSMQNVKTLGRDAHWFAANHENRFPVEANWPEALRAAPGFAESSLTDPASPASGRAYAINAKVAGHQLSAIHRPDRAVLFFECAFGSPPGGGPELLPPQPRRPGGYVIGFCDGHVERILKEDLGQLLWEPGADAKGAKSEK